MLRRCKATFWSACTAMIGKVTQNHHAAHCPGTSSWANEQNGELHLSKYAKRIATTAETTKKRPTEVTSLLSGCNCRKDCLGELGTLARGDLMWEEGKTCVHVQCWPAISSHRWCSSRFPLNRSEFWSSIIPYVRDKIRVKVSHPVYFSWLFTNRFWKIELQHSVPV